ncbi:MAG: hypothetical protein AAFY13_06130 [Pseudomonadota bacterium]
MTNGSIISEPTLIVSSLERAREAFDCHRPAHIISILSEDEPRPFFPGIATSDHLKLYVECETGPTAHNETARTRTHSIVENYRAWLTQDQTKTDMAAKTDGKILIHCAKGVSRSMAAAYIILCLTHPDQDEASLARGLRKAAPHADPCLFMINHADDLLQRDGRMFDAIDDLPPCRTTIDAPIVLLPMAA